MKFSNSNSKHITEEEYDRFVRKYHLNLPSLYKEIMLTYNGGYPEKPCFEEDSIYFTPIIDDDFDMYRLLDVSGIDYLKLGLYPFCDGSADASFCIGLDNEKLGKIFFINEMGEYKKVKDSLEEFIDSLEEDYEDESINLEENRLTEDKPLIKRIIQKLFR